MTYLEIGCLIVLILATIVWERREGRLRKTIEAQKQMLNQCERQQFSLRFRSAAVENWVRGSMAANALIDLVSEDVFIKMIAMEKWPKASIRTLVEFIKISDSPEWYSIREAVPVGDAPHEQDTIQLGKYLAPNGRAWYIGYSEKFDKVIARERSGRGRRLEMSWERMGKGK